jgi:hypothetical protein
MTDKQTQTAKPRPRGRPRKMPTWDSPQAATEKPHWAEKFAQPDWSGEFASTQEDRLSLPKSVLSLLEDNGLVAEWKTQSVFGQQQDHRMGVYRRNGWQHIAPGDIPGIDVTEVEGLVLMIRPKVIHDKAKAMQRREAEARVQDMRRAHGEGVDVPGGSHPSATRSDFHRKSIEPIPIPGRDGD